MGLIRNVAALLFIIALPVALITTTIRVAANEPRLYEYAIDNYDGVQTTGIERSELLRGGSELRAYFNRGGDEPIFVRVQKDGEPVSLFNRDETAHLQDVKQLFQLSFRVQEVSVVFILAYVVGVFVWAREGSLRSLASQVLLSGLLTGVVVGIVGLVALTGFDAFWSQFHEVAFTNDLWKLDPNTDRLIQMFPEAFWRDASLFLGIVTLAEFGLLAVISATYLAVTRRDPETYSFPANAQAQF